MKLTDVQRAAVKLFSHRGFAAVGIRELGHEAGLNSATLYHYVGGKEELLISIMATTLQALLDAAKEAVSRSSDPRFQIAHLIRAHVGLSATNPLTSRVTDQEIRSLSSEHQSELVALRDDYESLFGRVLERGMRTGDFDITDPRMCRLALLEMCNGVANWYRQDGALTVAEVQDHYVEFGCRLVGVETVTPEELGDLPEPVQLLSEPTT